MQIPLSVVVAVVVEVDAELVVAGLAIGVESYQELANGRWVSVQ